MALHGNFFISFTDMTTGNQGAYYNQATPLSPQSTRSYQGLPTRSHSGRSYAMEPLPSRINAHGERNGFHGTGDKRNILSLRDPKGQFMFCIRCGLTSGGRRPILLCDYCPCAWHMDCLPIPLANPPDQKSGSDKVHNNWMCPNHIDHDLQELSEAAAPTGRASQRLPCPKYIDIDVLPTSELEDLAPKRMVPRKRAAPSDEAQTSLPHQGEKSGEANRQRGADLENSSRHPDSGPDSGPHSNPDSDEISFLDINDANGENPVSGSVKHSEQDDFIRTSLREFYRAVIDKLSDDQLERLQKLSPPRVSREIQRRKNEKMAATALIDLTRFEVLSQEEPRDARTESSDELRRLLKRLKQDSPAQETPMERKRKLNNGQAAGADSNHHVAVTSEDEALPQGKGLSKKSLGKKGSTRLKQANTELETLRSLRQLVDQRVSDLKKRDKENSVSEPSTE